MATAFRFSAAIGPHETQRWEVGGGDWFSADHFPQLDARPIATPDTFAEGDPSPALHYGDFAVVLSAEYPYLAAYFVSVTNNSDLEFGYQMRVWVP
jgi:hypothetical protein